MSTYVEDPSSGERSAWTVLVIILVVVIGVLALGYFAWWAPNHETVVVNQQPVVTTPTPTTPSSPSGSPGPSGPAGAPGPSGPAGAPAPTTPAAPTAPAAPAGQ